MYRVKVRLLFSISENLIANSSCNSAKYIVQAIKKIQTDQIRSLVVKQPIQDAFNDYVQEVHKDLVWTGSCQSWCMNLQPCKPKTLADS